MDRKTRRITNSASAMIDPLRPCVEAVDIPSMFHGISRICRYTGATSRFYSVGHHSLIVSEILEKRFPDEPEIAFAGLLHDAHEAYIGDLAYPLKPSIRFCVDGEMVGRQELEDRWNEAVALRVGIDPGWFGDPRLDEVDKRIPTDEMRELFSVLPDEVESSLLPELGMGYRVASICDLDVLETTERLHTSFRILQGRLRQPGVSWAEPAERLLRA